jgi:cytoskeletal protein RodZ
MNLTIRDSAGIVGCVTEDKERPLGDWLRRRREELGISLEQVEEDTRIRVRYLQALETENFEALPDAVVGRGFLRNYCTYLDLDPLEAASRYSRFLAPLTPEPLPVREPFPATAEAFRPVPLHEMPGLRSRRGLLVGGLLILVAALSVLAWWSYPRLRVMFSKDPAVVVTATAAATRQVASASLSTATHTPTVSVATTTAPPTGTPLEATPTLELTFTPTFTPSPSPTPSPPIYTGIFIELVFTDTSWIQVAVDGVRQFQGVLEDGTYKSWYAEEQVVLRIGNAGAVDVTVNGQRLGHLGLPGEVVDRVFEKVGEQVTQTTATPPVTGTVTVTPTIAPTGRPVTPPATAAPTLEPAPSVSPTAILSPTEPITPTAGP